MNDLTYFEYLKELIKINSSTGYTKEINQYINNELNNIFKFQAKERKNRDKHFHEQMISGENYAYISGVEKDRLTVIMAHVDKVGLIVKSINHDGTLTIEGIGGIKVNSLNERHAIVIPRKNKKEISGILKVTGKETKVIKFYPNIAKCDKNIMINEYGISVGSFVFVENEIVENDDFIVGRYLDNTTSVAIALNVIKILIEENKHPKNSLLFIFTETEETGSHARIPNDERLKNKVVEELIALDVGEINENVNSEDVSILAKDSFAVYDYESINKLIDMADEFEIDASVDVCDGGTDASMMKYHGAPYKIIAFGPTIENLHGVERVNTESLYNTFQLLCAYIAN